MIFMKDHAFLQEKGHGFSTQIAILVANVAKEMGEKTVMLTSFALCFLKAVWYEI